MSRTAAAGMVGGITAELTGGSFEDGLQSAAFTQLFNDNAVELRNIAKSYISRQINAIKAAPTSWHFEGRDARNRKFASFSIDQVENAECWTEMPGLQSSAHQDEIPGDERKFIHEEGGELVFSGKDNSLVTVPVYKGTYNYINAVAWSDVNGVGGFA
ncbi:hypothetical protein [Reinekea sp.]|uniref:hypothetical protein n=1 Tax=Reinekea sp. TaxID=1970455 RepID=UPI002A7F9282|nr:hypothetical protein [Reinekea sp.]